MIAEALLARSRGGATDGPDQEFASQVIARCAVAAMRSAGLRDWQLRQSGRASTTPTELIRQAFALARDL